MSGGTDVLPPSGATGQTDETDDSQAAEETAASAEPSLRRKRTLTVIGLTAVVAAPLVIALGALARPHWYPLLDLAQTEMRVRDVGGRHSPLVGLVGRINAYGVDGSHPGPISFWALAPIYRLLGSTAYSLLVGAVVLNITAIGLSLWVALRQGGTRLALVVAAIMALLLHVFGTSTLTEPWNPYMPVLWWFLTVLAVWAVLCDDLPMLPVAVFAASFCMQTHVSYLGLIGGLVLLMLGALVVRIVQLRHDRAALRRLLAWTAAAVALGVVLWIPPLIDQLINDPGNAAIIIKNFREPDTDPLGVSRAAEAVGTHLNLWRFLGRDDTVRTGSVLPAAGLLAVWLGAVAFTFFRRRAAEDDGERRKLLRFHGLVAAVLVLGLITVSRIFGFLWFYLTLWAWAVTALILVAIVWSLLQALPRGDRQASRRLTVGVAVALVAVLAIGTVRFGADGARAEVSRQPLTNLVGMVSDPVDEALASGDLPGGGRDGRYLVTWGDPADIGAPGWGLVDELERRGYDVGVSEPFALGAVRYRFRPPDRADAEIHLSVGVDMDQWEDRPGYTRIAYADGRTAAERAEFERLRADVIEALEAEGNADLVPSVDNSPFGLYYEPRAGDAAREGVAAMLAIGLPMAVYVGPPVVNP
jgi:hypothetical protein